MRRYFLPLVLLFAAVTLLVSCLNSDNEEVVYSDDVAITAFSIASAEMTVHTTSSTGEDSIYTTSNTSMSSYKFVIDQTKGEIYNVDSLPNNIDASKLLVNCSTKNNGIALIRSIEKPDSINYVSSSDTIDFTQPRTICVYSASGKYTRDYTVKVNVHQQDGDEMVWKTISTNAGLADLTSIRGFEIGGSLYVLGVNGSHTLVYGADAADGSVWTQRAILSANASLDAVVRYGKIYVLDGTDVKTSADGANFETVLAQSPLSRLVAQSSAALYGIGGDGMLMASEDGGKTWQTEDIDFGTVIPSRDITYCTVSYGGVHNAECVLLAGNRDVEAYPSDSTGVVLPKIVEKTPGAKKNAWSGVTYNSWDDKFLPRLDNLNVFPYGGAVYALGGAGLGACNAMPFDAFGKSLDYGFSWDKAEDVVLPSDFDTSVEAFAVFADNSGYVWMICVATGTVWRGRLNKVGWGD